MTELIRPTPEQPWALLKQPYQWDGGEPRNWAVVEIVRTTPKMAFSSTPNWRKKPTQYSLDQIIAVFGTEAAATEARQRAADAWAGHNDGIAGAVARRDALNHEINDLRTAQRTAAREALKA